MHTTTDTRDRKPANVRPDLARLIERLLAAGRTTTYDALVRASKAPAALERYVALTDALRCMGERHELRAEVTRQRREAAEECDRCRVSELRPGDRFARGYFTKIHTMQGREGTRYVTDSGRQRFDGDPVVVCERVPEPTGTEPDDLHPAATLEEKRTSLHRQLEGARREVDKVADQLAWALDTGKPDEHVDQIEARLDERRAVTHQILREIKAVDAALVARADDAFADAHPDLVFGEVLQAGNSLEILKKRADQLERDLRSKAHMPSEREWRAVRAAIRKVSSDPEWCEARQDDAEAVERFEHDASAWRRERTQVGLMSLAEVA